MTFNNENYLADQYPGSRLDELSQALRQTLVNNGNLETVFRQFTTALQRQFEITKGFLAIRDGSCTRFLAVASFRDGGTTRRLSLKLPDIPSLFEKVAESRETFSNNFAEMFDGNHIEKRLLIDDNTVSYMLKPLKCEGRVVGLLGFSSDRPDTFVTIEEGLLDSAFERLGEIVGAARTEPAHV